MCKRTVGGESQLSADDPCLQFIPVVITDCTIRDAIAHLHSPLLRTGATHQTNATICTGCRERQRGKERLKYRSVRCLVQNQHNNLF